MIKKVISGAVIGLSMISAVVFAGTEEKVLICHATGSNNNSVKLLSVSASAVNAHLNHGDFLYPNPETGSCASSVPTPL